MNAIADEAASVEQSEQHRKNTSLSCEKKQLDTRTPQEKKAAPLQWRSVGSHMVDIHKHLQKENENSVSGELSYTVDALMPINEILEKVADEFAIPSAIPVTPAEVRHLATARYHLEKQMAFLLNRYFSQYRENNDTENHMNTGVGAASSQPPSSAVPPAAGARASSFGDG